MARPETFQPLPKPRGQLFPLLGLLAFALLLQGRDARAASLQGVEGAPPMAKIYPRGSHWAVGHFMGKKSTRDFPYIYEERQEMPFSLLPDNVKQPGSFLQQDESFKELLKRMEENEDQSTQVLQEELPFSSKNIWGAEESSSFKDLQRGSEEEEHLASIAGIESQHLSNKHIIGKGKTCGFFRHPEIMMELLLQVMNKKESTPS